MAKRVFWWWGAAIAAIWATAMAEPARPPYEVVKDHVAITVAKDGSYVDTREQRIQVLDSAGIKMLQERKLFYTRGFEALEIVAAYTLKADGRRLDVPPGAILSGFGQSSQPGFFDNHIVSLYYPNLEVGDSVVLNLRHRQLVPWFPGYFDIRATFSSTVVVRDTVYSVSVPEAMALHVDAVGLEGGTALCVDGRVTRVFRFTNPTPVLQETDAVSEADFAAHLNLSTFADYAEVAASYRDRARDKTKVTQDIAALAQSLTKGVTDRRAQAKILYDWVSAHIAYVAIELGAGGFTPHAAHEVLANRFGDCKDHVALLEALLAAKGIESTAALIHAGGAAYLLPTAASPHAFDHVITYLPDFDLFVDSSAAIAPFGVLPYADAGKPVVLADDGRVMRTKSTKAAESFVRLQSTVDIAPDGTASGRTQISTAGAIGIQVRALMQSIDVGKDNAYLRELLGPGAEGHIERGTPSDLTDPFAAAIAFTLPGALSLPGPGALSSALSPRPFSFSSIIAGTLPPARGSAYVCASLTAEDVQTITFPPGVKLIAIPDGGTLRTDGITLTTENDRKDARTLVRRVKVKIDHPEPVCSPAYYAATRDALRKMTKALREQVLYRGGGDGAP